MSKVDLKNIVVNFYNLKKEYDEVYSDFISNLDEDTKLCFTDDSDFFDNVKKFMDDNKILLELSDGIRKCFPKYGETRVKNDVITTYIDNYLNCFVDKNDFDDVYEEVDKKYEIVKKVNEAGFYDVLEKEKEFNDIIKDIKNLDIDLSFDPQTFIINIKDRITSFDNEYKDKIINAFAKNVNKNAKVLSKVFSEIAKKTENNKED